MKKAFSTNAAGQTRYQHEEEGKQIHIYHLAQNSKFHVDEKSHHKISYSISNKTGKRENP